RRPHQKTVGVARAAGELFQVSAALSIAPAGRKEMMKASRPARDRFALCANSARRVRASNVWRRTPQVVATCAVASFWHPLTTAWGRAFPRRPFIAKNTSTGGADHESCARARIPGHGVLACCLLGLERGP